MTYRLHLPSAGSPPPGAPPARSAKYTGVSPRPLYGKTCLVTESRVPGYSMVQFDDMKRLPVAWTHGWHLRPTADLDIKDY